MSEVNYSFSFDFLLITSSNVDPFANSLRVIWWTQIYWNLL